MILGELRASVQRHTGARRVDALITVPAHFTLIQRHATVEAATLAGLSVLRILNEPTAAALAFGAGTTDTKEDVRHEVPCCE